MTQSPSSGRREAPGDVERVDGAAIARSFTVAFVIISAVASLMAWLAWSSGEPRWVVAAFPILGVFLLFGVVSMLYQLHVYRASWTMTANDA